MYVVLGCCTDNVPLQIDGVLYMKIQDAYKASYGIENAEFAITQVLFPLLPSHSGILRLSSPLYSFSLCQIICINLYYNYHCSLTRMFKLVANGV